MCLLRAVKIPARLSGVTTHHPRRVRWVYQGTGRAGGALRREETGCRPVVAHESVCGRYRNRNNTTIQSSNGSLGRVLLLWD